MSKNPKKTLLTVLLAFCLLIGQAALFGGAVTHAATAGTTMVFAAGSASSNAQGTATTISLQGTGYAPGTPVTVTFNAAYTSSGSSVPAGNSNVITVTQTSDSSGNIGTTGAGAAPGPTLTGTGAGVSAPGVTAAGISATAAGITGLGATGLTITGAVVSTAGGVSTITAGTISGAPAGAITGGTLAGATLAAGGTVSGSGAVTAGTVTPAGGAATSIVGNTITSGTLFAGTLGPATLGTAGTITAGTISAGTVSGGNLATVLAGAGTPCTVATPCTLTGVALTGGTVTAGTASVVGASVTAGTLAGATFSAITATAPGAGVGATGALKLTIPATVPAGTYAIVGSDVPAGSSHTSTPLYYTVTAPTLTVSVAGGYVTTPTTGSNSVGSVPSVPLGGELSIVGTGLLGSAPVVFELVNINGGAISPSAPPDVALTVASCPAFGIGPAETITAAVAPGSFGGITAFPTSCAADVNGNVFATVQLPAAVGATYAGQTWAVVASNGTGVGAETGTLTQKFNGVHIDNTVASLTPSSLVAGPGSPITVTGGGFGSGASVTIVPCTGAIPAGAGTACPAGTSAVGSALTVTADSSGHIPAGTTYTIPAGTTVGTVTLTAIDTTYGNTATTIIGVNTAAAVTGNLTLSTTTASVGQTVTFTATKLGANDVVTVKVTSSSGTCGSAGFVATTLVSDATGTARGSFAVPACVVTVPNTTTGVTATIAVTDSNTGASASATLAILPATISISQAANTLFNTITITGTGFQASENVSITYSPVGGGTPAAGTSNTLTVTADATGSFSVSTANAFGTTSGYYTVKGAGLTSGFTASSTGQVNIGGYLSFPASVVPGQVIVVTGTTFSPGTGTISANFAPTAAPTTAITVNASGIFTATLTVPTGTTPGSYNVTVSAPVPNGSGGSTVQTRVAPITVTALPTSSIGLSPTTTQVGNTVSVTGTGYAPNEPIAISIQYGATSGLSGTDVPGTRQATFTADSTGAISTTYTVQSTVSNTLVPGSYNLAVTGVNSGVKNVMPLTINGVIQTGVTTNIFFAEGFTGSTSAGASANFSETLSILNSNNYTTTYTVSYFKEGATAPISVTGTIGAFSVVDRSVNTDVGSGASVAAQVSAPAPIAAERTITRSTATGASLGASTSLGQVLDLKATPPASGFDYYFASGAVQLTSEEYLTILNPNATAASVTINILPQTAISATTTTTVAPIKVTVGAMARLTVPLRKTLLGLGAGVGFQFGMDVNSTLPVAVENVMYQGDGIGSAKYGSTTTPAGSGAFHQYLFAADFGVAPSAGLAAGAIGTGNDVSEVDIINPGAAANGSATVTVSFFSKSGTPINSQQIQVDGGTRETVSVNDIAGVNNDVFSVVVTSDRSIYVQLPISFGGNPSKGGMYATENIAGSVPGLTSAAFPNLSLANGTTSLSQTVFLYNPGASAITVNAVFSAGTKSVTKTYTVSANSITQVNVATDAAGLGVTTGIGGFFSVSTSTPGSLVAFAQGNTADYKWAIGTQGTYASSFSSGS